jgi:hypothetical protein
LAGFLPGAGWAALARGEGGLQHHSPDPVETAASEMKGSTGSILATSRW